MTKTLSLLAFYFHSNKLSDEMERERARKRFRIRIAFIYLSGSCFFLTFLPVKRKTKINWINNGRRWSLIIVLCCWIHYKRNVKDSGQIKYSFGKWKRNWLMTCFFQDWSLNYTQNKVTQTLSITSDIDNVCLSLRFLKLKSKKYFIQIAKPNRIALKVIFFFSPKFRLAHF